MGLIGRLLSQVNYRFSGLLFLEDSTNSSVSMSCVLVALNSSRISQNIIVAFTLIIWKLKMYSNNFITKDNWKGSTENVSNSSDFNQNSWRLKWNSNQFWTERVLKIELDTWALQMRSSHKSAIYKDIYFVLCQYIFVSKNEY